MSCPECKVELTDRQDGDVILHACHNPACSLCYQHKERA